MKIYLLCLIFVALPAFGSDLDEYLKKENITIPLAIKKKIADWDLIPMFGMEIPSSNCGESHFLIEYCRSSDIANPMEPQELDILREKTVMSLQCFRLTKKCIMSYHGTRKIWGGIPYEPRIIIVEFSFL